MACYEYLYFPYLKFSILFLLEDFSVFEFILIDNLRKLTPKLFSACFHTKPFFVQISLLSSIVLWLDQFFPDPYFLYCSFAFCSTSGNFFLFLFCCFLEVFLKDLNFWIGCEIILVASGSSSFLLTEIPLQAKVFWEERVLSGIDQVMCWAFVLFELGPLGRTMSYLLGPIRPLWTWAFWQNCIFFICLGCSTEWWWSI